MPEKACVRLIGSHRPSLALEEIYEKVMATVEASNEKLGTPPEKSGGVFVCADGEIESEYEYADQQTDGSARNAPM